jgi:hypothetical protein
MTSTSPRLDSYDIHSIPWVGLVLTSVGGLALVIWLLLTLLLWVKPPEKPLPGPWSPYEPAAIALPLLVAGIVLIRDRKVYLRLKPNEIEFPKYNLTLPWSEIEVVEVVNIPIENSAGIIPLLVMYLTPQGRLRAVSHRPPKSHLADRFKPIPDISINPRFLFWSFGPGLDTPRAFAADLKMRKLAAEGKLDESMLPPPPPPMDAPLEIRKSSRADFSGRSYVHEMCGQSTLVNDGSLYWLVNPLRYTGGASMCSRCGQAMDNTLRWVETGETVGHFRSRMWRHTPLWVKLAQFVFAPAAIGIVTALLLPAQPPMAPWVAASLAFGVGYVVGFMAIVLTPLAGVFPAAAGMKYHQYL